MPGAPGGEHQPCDDQLAEIISRNAISDAEADLLLGIGPEAEPARPAAAPERPEAAAGRDSIATDLPEGALTQDEADDLLGLAPGPVMLPTSAGSVVGGGEPAGTTERSGASGATVLNELVDEIARDLERDLDRHPPPVRSRRYGRTIGCWVSPLSGPSPAHPKHSTGKRDEEETA